MISPDRVEFDGPIGRLWGQVWDPGSTAGATAGALCGTLVLWHHGSKGRQRGLTGPRGTGRTGLEAWLDLGATVFAPSRRGYDGAAGPLLKDVLAPHEHGSRSYYRCLVARLDDELGDVFAALRYARTQRWGQERNIICSGYSLGALLTVMALAECSEFTAGVTFALGAITWDHSSEVRRMVLGRLADIRLPLMVIYARNDYSVTPATAIEPLLTDTHPASRVMLLPPYGSSAEDGHVVSSLGADQWQPHVQRFLQTALSETI
jgi:dienelactone hydrolase